MLKIIKNILAVIVFILAAYSLVTQNFTYQPYTLLFLSAFFLVLGIIELQKDKKIGGFMYIAVSLYGLFISIQGFF